VGFGIVKMNYNQNSGYGRALLDRLSNIASSVCPTFGRIFVVLSTSDTADPNYNILAEVIKHDPEGNLRLFTSLKAAYDATTSNNDDVILLGGHSDHVLASALTISKNRIHFVGMDGGDRLMQQGAKVINTDGTAAVWVVKNTGTRNTFKNIKFIQTDDDATSLTVFQEAGEGTLFQNCSFVFAVADNLDQTDAYEFVMGGDTSTFKECTFGNDTLETSAARAVMAFDKLMSDSPKSNYWKDCLWQINSSDADAHFIRVLANTDMKFTQTFVDCTFNAALTNSMGTATLTETVENDVQAVEGNMLFVRPATNTTDFATASNGNTNIKVVAAASVTNAIEGIAPTA